MGRLLSLGILVLVFCCSFATSTLSTSKKDLERAAELAVERAAEKAAERAVEKALNSGNSSTITVTVKESYANVKKTAEEAAAPGSESTRSQDPELHSSRYAYEQTDEGEGASFDQEQEIEKEEEEEEQQDEKEEDGEYEVKEEEAEEEEKPERSKEEEDDLSGEDQKSAKMSIERVESEGGSTPGLRQDYDGYRRELVPTYESEAPDISSEASIRGNFGLKSANNQRTKTFSRSYSSPKSDFPETKVDVPDNEDAQIFKMYRHLDKNGWSLTKQKGWIRHRPLWDDNKTGRVDRNFWDDFREMSSGETIFGKGHSHEDRLRAHRGEQYSLPVAAADLNRGNPIPVYQKPYRQQVVSPLQQTYSYRSKPDKNGAPLKLFITIPVSYPLSYKSQRMQDGKVESKKRLKNQLGNVGVPKQIHPKSYDTDNAALLFVDHKNTARKSKLNAFLSAPVYHSSTEIPAEDFVL